MKDRTSVTRSGFFVLVLAVSLAVACGGRYQDGREGSEGGAAGSSGASAAAGRGGSIALAGMGGKEEGAAGRGGAPADCQIQAYWDRRQAVEEKAAYGCASDSECMEVAPRNACEQGCAYAPVWYGASDAFEAGLSSLAKMYCPGCIAGPIPSCRPPEVLVCSSGRCTIPYVK